MNEKRYFYIEPQDYETAARNGIHKRAVDQRVRVQGWDIDRAITQPVGKHNKKTGVWSKWKNKSVVCYGTFASRISSGWDAEKAALTPPIPHSERNHKRGVITKEHLKIAEKYGISKKVISCRIFGCGWDIEKAITTPVMTRKQASMLGTKKRRELGQLRRAENN